LLYEVVLTDEERQRIIDQNWTASDGIARGTRLFQRAGGLFSPRWALARQADGACIFLNEKGLCRIHAKFGEPAKPLVCRLFPFVLYPAGNRVAVSLRFSCPSAAGSRGKPIRERRSEIEEFVRLGATAEAKDPPAISRGERLDWPDTLRIVTRLAEMLGGDEAGEALLPLRVIHASFVAQMLGQAKFEKVRGPGRCADGGGESAIAHAGGAICAAASADRGRVGVSCPRGRGAAAHDTRPGKDPATAPGTAAGGV
jgi:lysine-N-methylase